MNSGNKLIKALWLLPVLFLMPVLFASAALTGQQIYDQNCAGCHSLGAYDTTGSPNLLGVGSKVGGKFNGGVSHHGATLVAADITSVAAFINNPTTAPAPLAVSTATLPGGAVGTAYSQTLAATGGTTPYRWSVTAGSLPAGMTLSSTGVITGTPTTAVTSSFTVRVTDSAATTASATKALSITISASSPAPLAISTANLASGTVGTAYSQTLATTGGRTPYTWNYNGTLPPGIAVTSSGAVTGTPTTAGTYSFTVSVIDSRSTTATQSLSITIAAAVIPMSASDKNLFITNCLSCHTQYGLQNRTVTQIQAAIRGNVGGMGTTQLRALSTANLTAIARSLVPVTPPNTACTVCHSAGSPAPAPSPSPSQMTGQQIYDTYCASCHRLGTYDTTGSAPTLSGKGSLASGRYTAGVSGHSRITLSATDITNLTAFLNAH